MAHKPPQPIVVLSVLFSIVFLLVIALPAASREVRMKETLDVLENKQSALVLDDVTIRALPVALSTSEHFELLGTFEQVALEAGENETPELAGEPGPPLVFSLSQNFPNPFNPSTTIVFSVPEDEKGVVSLRIYTIRGKLVRSLVEKTLPPGLYNFHWDGRDEKGEPVSSGIYLYRLGQGERFQTRKMTLVR